MPNRYQLDEAIRIVLTDSIGKRASIREIHKVIFDRGLYRQYNGRGDFPPPSQISARISKRPDLFERVSRGIVRLIGEELHHED